MLKHLRGHEKLKCHTDAVRLRQREDTGPVSEHLNTHQVTVEDFDDIEDWTYVNSASGPSESPSLQEHQPKINISDDMRRALAGEVMFTAGDEFADDFRPSLEEVLSGVGLFKAAIHPFEQDDEAPAFMTGEDEDTGEDTAELPEVGPTSAQDVSDAFFGKGDDTDVYFPYPNKGMMKTDILFSSPRLRFSRAQQEAILAWGKDLGAKRYPPYMH
ncbi:hypothetical protein A0H81_07153 [Grifola frondosa]|uniref:Uncharacterized protein n=1 Tax=Grifola frondosa TaxID=5627 RepID=A0A1C7MEE5_GRIFR|nr:hypothetical protein A0H81_07153 [Grifola frondosa]